MWLDWFYIALGLGLLIAGGEVLVRGASGIALWARITPAVVGLTVVSAGTSAPELVVSVQSAIAGKPGIAVGNVVGSNIFNIAAILGIAALVRPLVIQGNTVKLEWPIMMLAAFEFVLLSRDGSLDRLEGGFLLTAMVAFTAYAVRMGKQSTTDVETESFESIAVASFGRTGRVGLLLNLGAVFLGIGFLAGGSTVLVRGAAAVAEGLGISKTIIGLTIVSAGTSMPELVTSLVAARRGRDDIAVANVVGSNIFNVLGIVGTTALIHPLSVPEEILRRDNWWMLGISLLLFPLMKSGFKLVRFEGAILLACFLGYMGVLFAGSAL